ncbi:MAG: 50S ribosomal protein L10 [Lentisphaerae bacterium GWF2_52_8]|nr:MAG: 50S ribosomal protein L10 [Lentisphaerae bacterium GWF2_52_8]
MRSEKIQQVNDIGAMIKNSSFIFFINYKGLKVKDFSALRSDLAQHKAECHVLKNRLILKAAELNGLEGLSKLALKGDTAVISGAGDASVVAKVLDTFMKARAEKNIHAKSGYMESAVLGAADVSAIAALPSRQVLQAQLLGVLLAPSRNLVTVLNAKVTSIVNVVNAYKDKLEKK